MYTRKCFMIFILLRLCIQIDKITVCIITNTGSYIEERTRVGLMMSSMLLWYECLCTSSTYSTIIYKNIILPMFLRKFSIVLRINKLRYNLQITFSTFCIRSWLRNNRQKSSCSSKSIEIPQWTNKIIFGGTS